MEYDLLGIIDKRVPLDPTQIKCIMKQILEGVCFLHSHNVMHRDIKAANILMNNKGEIKLADFGLARNTIDVTLLDATEGKSMLYTNPVVTLWYRAPELLLGSKKYTPAIDIWSVGCCFAELLNSKSLFNGGNEKKMMEQIFQKCGTPTLESWPEMMLYKHYKDIQSTIIYPHALTQQFKDNPK